MKIPNSLVIVHCEDGTTPIHTVPAYYAPLYKAIWGRRLTERGIEVQAVPLDASDAEKYTEISDVGSEAEYLRRKFGQMFDEVFPAGAFAQAVERMIREDAARIRASKAPVTYDIAALVAAGLPEAAAINLARRSITKPEQIESALMLLEAGLSPDEADAWFAKPAPAPAPAKVENAGDILGVKPKRP